MPTLNWIGKEKVINHHLDVPYKVLEHAYHFDAKNAPEARNVTSENKIIHGDNLEALKSLLLQYEGKVKCIYIDPPYNTGNEGWVYNDNVNDPKMKKWLGQVVGKEAEDLTRHDKWLCMMYPRLKLLHKLLADDGAIFISIDDNEQANLKLMCDEIFGGGNFVGNLPTIMNLKGNQDQFAFAGTHEYTLVYAKNRYALKIGNLLIEEEEAETWDKDETGFFKKGANLKSTGVNAPREKRPNLFYPIYISEQLEISPEKNAIHNIELLPITEGKEMSWRWSKEKLFSETYNLIITQQGNNYSIYKKQRPELGDLPSKKPKSVLYKPEYSSGNGTSQMKNIFGDKSFQTPKPLALIYDLLQIATDKNSLILDSFAGSGTTAHAVLNLNKQDGGNRKFILIEMEDYAETITAERVKRVMKGMAEEQEKAEKLAAATPELLENENITQNKNLDLSFEYYRLGEALFEDTGNLNEKVGVEKMREYIYYSETGMSLLSPPSPPKGGEQEGVALQEEEREQEGVALQEEGGEQEGVALQEEGGEQEGVALQEEGGEQEGFALQGEGNEYFLGNYNEVAYYFYYVANEITTLDYAFLGTIKEKAEMYIIYADNCLLSADFLTRHKIFFKKIPREIRRV